MLLSTLTVKKWLLLSLFGAIVEIANPVRPMNSAATR